MAAHGIAAAALTTRTGRKILVGVIVVTLLAAAFLATPLVAIPFAIAGAAASAPTNASGTVPTASGAWGYPLAGGYSKGRGFGYNPVTGCGYCSTNHQGYDMAQGCGSTIFAAGPGVVITAGSYQGYGNTVRIDHGDELVTLYGHMEWSSLRVSVGEQVTAGTAVGAEGNTGNSFGCHLHFEVRQSGNPIPPEPFMAARGLPLK
ncbi:M23 family metallopeptidase [Microbacterium sp. NPDC056003]|uniref:M23 family metallopeptidase n=1 Tax=Microbacterium sp. NPDC056003 TaxID=3345676 RepID=UPI0035E00A31